MSRTSVTQRFWAKVKIDDAGCWRWKAAIQPNGYGYFFAEGKMRYAHRVAYDLFVGPIPEGLDLDHLCRVRDCVNPDHLEAVDRRTNLMRGDTLARAHAEGRHCGHAACLNCKNKVPS